MDFKNFKQRGQVLLFYALLVPLLMLFVGVGMDLGWYYFNVSRLQNAADAAALAGAQKIIAEDDNFKNTYDVDSIRFVENIFDNEPYSLATAGDVEAATYVRKNLSPETMTEAVKEGNAYVMHDDWGLGSNTELTMAPSLYKRGDNFYYVVNLTENIRHFFLPGWFGDMAAPVVAVAILSPKTEDEPENPENPIVVPEEKIEEIEDVINSNVIVGNWEVQNYYRYLNNSSNDKTTVTDEKTGKTSEKTLTRAETLKNASALKFTPARGICSKTTKFTTKTATSIVGKTSKFLTTLNWWTTAKQELNVTAMTT